MTEAERAGRGMLLGVDAGGTRTTAWVVDEAGAVRGRADGGPANYQSIVPVAARRTLGRVVERALDAAGTTAERVDGAGYGIAGADRPKDFAAIEQQLPPRPVAAQRTLVNDTQLALRAGTPDGVGVALISGTGTNHLGRGPDGTIARIGGYCYELGDFGSASDLGREALRLAVRGHDGRGEPTALYARLCEALRVEPLEDIIDLWMNKPLGTADPGRLGPVVFETAAGGDAVARRLLERAGEELALAARLLLDQLFAPGAPATVVLGGSVLQLGYDTDPTLVNTITQQLRQARPEVRVVRLNVEPVVGAVLLAHDGLGTCAGADCPFETGLREAVGTDFAVEIALGA